MQLDLSSPQIFRPVQSSRRSEFILWGLAIITMTSWAILRNNSSSILILTPILSAFLAIFAAALSLGNWIDRKSRLTIDSDSISFTNGLRNQQFHWREIKQVRLVSASLGSQRVFVISDEARFSFKTFAQAFREGQLIGQSGFEAGSDILETILEHSNLRQRPIGDDRVIYYTRD